MKKRIHMKPELVMVLIAMVSALALMGMLIACIPYYYPKEDADPEALLQHQRELEQAMEQTEPLPETEPEETAVPTIPPEANPYTKRDFQYSSHNFLLCTQQDSYPGVDVSSFQGVIDWEKVRASGIRFAMVRLGFRGYGQAGNMVEDEFARRNLEGAQKAGLEVGAYFFSQATTIDEVDDEIFFFMKTLGDFELTMPIVLDWEHVGVETARRLRGMAPVDFPQETAIGALGLYVSNGSIGNFQPMNVNFGIIPPLDHRVKGKRNKNAELSARSLAIIEERKEDILQ